MRSPTWDIDSIVSEVVRRLRASSAPKRPSEIAPSELVLEGRLITLATIEGRLKRVTRLVVSSAAVVTPAVRDELNQHDIQLHRTPRGEEVCSSHKVWIGIDHETTGEDRWTALLDKPNITPCRGTTTELIEQAAKNEGPKIIVTHHLAMAACLANRHQHIRAAAVRDIVEAGEAIDTMQANLLVVHAERTSPFQLQKIIELLCNAV